MSNNRDIGKVLLRLDDFYYEKGMKRISVSLKGIRNDKILNTNRKVVIPQLIRSKNSEKFIKEFIENIRDDLETLVKDENIVSIIENPNDSNILESIDICQQQLLYIYLESLHDEKYNQVLQKLLSSICSVDQQIIENNSKEENINFKIEEYEKKCKSYEETISKLKVIAKQRKEKLSELERKINVISEENHKLNNQNGILLKQIENLKVQIQNFLQNDEQDTNFYESKEKSSRRIAVISNHKILCNENDGAVTEMTVDEFLFMNAEERAKFEKICVYKKSIHIAKLRKIKQISNDKAVFYESKEEILKIINNMEDENEDRRN